MRILAIDPGPKHSGVVLFEPDSMTVVKAYKKDNGPLLDELRESDGINLAIEVMAAMGMAVAQVTFDTQLWAGRFIEAVDDRNGTVRMLVRMNVKMHLCGHATAKDTNVTRAVKDRFPATGGGKDPQKGIKSKPGPLYGISGSDVWSALAIAVTAAETTDEQ